MNNNRRQRGNTGGQSVDIDQIIRRIPQIISEGGKPLVETAEELGPRFEQGDLTANQIRNAFGHVKQMQMTGFDPKRFILLKPKLAYAAARASRASKECMTEFKNVMTAAIDAVGESEERFNRFVDFFEAILAYYKAAKAAKADSEE